MRIKRMTALLIAAVLCVLMIPTIAAAEGEAQYKADIWVDCAMRREPDTASYRMLSLKDKNEVSVLEYGEEWCKIERKGQVGYVKTVWMCRFRSLDPYTYAVPGYTKQTGYALVTSSFVADSEDYDGTVVPENSTVAVQRVTEDGYELAVARGTKELNPLYVRYVPFADWEAAAEEDILYAFTTYYNDHFAKKLNAERIFNIELACERISGTRVAPGESFSFNALCAPYRKSNGYLKAPNISAEGYGYGGGVCQVSTTLYNCLLGLPLQVDKWEVHRDRGVSYIPQHFDSAVGSYSDLAFTNTMPYEIVIEAMPQEGALTVLIRAGNGAAEKTEEAVPETAEDTIPEDVIAGAPRMCVLDPDTGDTPLLAAPDGEERIIPLPAGITVSLLDREDGMSHITVGGYEGYVPDKFLYLKADAVQKTCSVALKLRTLPSEDAPIRCTVKKGGKVTVYITGETWAYVTCETGSGYVLAKYLK